MVRLAFFLMLLPSFAVAAEPVRIVGGKADATDVVVTVPAPEGIDPVVWVSLSSGAKVLGQVVSADYFSDAKGSRLQFVAPTIKAGESLGITTSHVKPVEYPTFHYTGGEGGSIDLLFQQTNIR